MSKSAFRALPNNHQYVYQTAAPKDPNTEFRIRYGICMPRPCCGRRLNALGQRLAARSARGRGLLACALRRGSNERVGCRRAIVLSAMFSLGTLTCAILSGCTGNGAAGAKGSATSPPRSPAGSPQVLGPPGSVGNPLVLSCDAESWPGPPLAFHPRLADLVIGPLVIVNGKMASRLTAAEYGYRSYGHGGRAYKMAMVLTTDSTVTVTIAPSARGHVVIDIPSTRGGVTSATYHACARPGGFFAQGLAFTHPPARGCVPLDVKIDNRPAVRHVTLSLFAGLCA